MNGLDCMQQAKTVSADTRFILISAFGSLDPNLETQAYKEGAVCYLAKPIEPRALLEAVQLFIRKSS